MSSLSYVHLCRSNLMTFTLGARRRAPPHRHLLYIWTSWQDSLTNKRSLFTETYLHRNLEIDILRYELTMLIYTNVYCNNVFKLKSFIGSTNI